MAQICLTPGQALLIQKHEIFVLRKTKTEELHPPPLHPLAPNILVNANSGLM